MRSEIMTKEQNQIKQTENLNRIGKKWKYKIAIKQIENLNGKAFGTDENHKLQIKDYQ